MKRFVLVIFSLSFFISFSQDSYKLRDSEIRTIKKGMVYVEKFADSLNSYSCNNCTTLPNFFYNYNFDKENGYRLSRNMHGSVSIRKLIIDRITNTKLLRAVLRSKDKRLRKSNKTPKKSYIGDVVRPYQEYSTCELVKYRLQELQNGEIMGKRATNYPYKNN